MTLDGMTTIRLTAKQQDYVRLLPRGQFAEIVRTAIDASLLANASDDPAIIELRARCAAAVQRRKDIDLAYSRVVAGTYAPVLARHGLTRGLRKDLVVSIREWVIAHLDYVPIDDEVQDAIRRNYNPRAGVIAAAREAQKAAAERTAGERVE